MRRKHSKQTTYRGEFVDLHQLGFAMDDERYSLEAAGKAYGVTHGKLHVAEHGRITDHYIDYNRRDTQETEELFCPMLTEFLKHPIDLPPTEAYSPASVAKAYLQAMGIPPILQKLPGFPRSVLGYGMEAFYGGRAECRIRRTLVPVVHMDFTSMYPTVFSLLGFWDFLICADLDIATNTVQVRKLLSRPDLLDYCFMRDGWRELGCCLVQIGARGEILPVRARYGADKTWNIGLNPLTCDQPLWFALPDVVAATLLTGRPPQILRAMRLIPRGRLLGLRPVLFRGVVPIDPRTQNFFQVAIEERKRLSRRSDLPAADRDRLDLSLKITANAGAYGILGQFDRHVLPHDITEPVWLYTGGKRIKVSVAAPEEPGKFAFPPLAACITAGARLMLALLERLVTDAGRTYAFCDTDSMAVVATEAGGMVACPGGASQRPHRQGAVLALCWDMLEKIRARFTALNPYDQDAVPDSILRLEKVNLDAVTGARRQVYCYAISAKRYALCTQSPEGCLTLCDWSEHGLGLYVNPTDPDHPNRQWMQTVWEGILAEDVHDQRYQWPDWAQRPAASQISVSAPSLLRPFRQLNAQKPYADQVKPFNFLATVHVAPFGHPLGVDPERFHLIAPWTSDARLWMDMKWINRYSTRGDAYQITTRGTTGREGVARVKTMADVIAEYARHPEVKSLDAQGAPCGEGTKGLLYRRPVVATHIRHIGKESNDLKNRAVGLVHDREEVVTEYPDPRHDPFKTHVLPVLQSWSARRIARSTNIDATSIARIRSGRKPHPAHRTRLVDLAANIARAALRKWRITCPDDDLACCYVYLQQRAQRGIRRCRVCRKPLRNLRARYCSAACKHRAFRRRRRSNATQATLDV